MFKSDVDLKIPPKKEVLVYCPMSERQSEMYEATVTRTLSDLINKDKEDEQEKINREGGRGKRNKANIDYSVRNRTFQSKNGFGLFGYFLQVFLGSEGTSERNLNEYLDKLKQLDSTRENAKNSISAYTAERINSDVR